MGDVIVLTESAAQVAATKEYAAATIVALEARFCLSSISLLDMIPQAAGLRPTFPEVRRDRVDCNCFGAN